MSLLRVFKRLFSGNQVEHTAAAALSRDAIERAIRPVVESLEERQLLSAVLYPTITVLGTNGAVVAYHEASPVTTDGTDFGSLDTKKNAVETFTVKNTGAGVLNLTAFSRVQVTGADAADFIVIAQPAAQIAGNNGTSTFKLKFQPTRAALETATVTIYNDTDGTDPYTFNIQGTGTQTSKASITGNGKVLAPTDTVIQVSDNTQFGNVEATNGSITKTFNIKNLGSGTLNLGGTPKVAFGGTDAAAFSLVGSAPASIAAGANADITVKFQPGTAGVKNATITIATDDPSAASYHWAVQGTGVTEAVMGVQGTGSAAITAGRTTTATADGTDFGTADITAGSVTKTFTILNTGSSSLGLTGTPVVDIKGDGKSAFSVVAQPANSIAAAGTLTFQLKFAPGSVGTKNATITIANNDPILAKAYTFAVTGNAVSQAKIDVQGGTTPTDIVSGGSNVVGTTDGTDFGTVDKTGGASTHTFTIKDLGSGAVHLTGVPKVAISGTDAADFTVTTAPADATLAGKATTRVAALPPKPSAKAAANTTNSHGHHVSHGKRHHTVSAVPVVPNSTTFAIKFDPSSDTVTGKTAVVTIASDDPNVPSYTFNIGGTATSSSIMAVSGSGQAIASGDVAPLTVDGTDFGSMDTTQSAQHSFVLTNTGTTDLTITGGLVLSNTTDFSVVTDTTGTVVNGTPQTVTLKFNPASAGVKTSTVTMTTNDPANPTYTFTVKGTGVPAPVAAVTGNSNPIAAGATTAAVSTDTDFGNAELNFGSVNKTFTITNSGSTAMTISRIKLDGANKNDFAFVGTNPTTVAASGTATFQVKFRPTGTGARNATVMVQSNDVANPSYNFAVKGTAVRLPVITATGKGLLIAGDGSNSPGTTDNTDFGSVDAARPVTKTFVIKNTGSDALNLTAAVAFGGTNSADFSVLNRPRISIPANGTAPFDVKFTPSSTGAEVATITLASDDAVTPAYTFNISGTGANASLMTVKGGSGQTTTIAAGDTTPQQSDGTDFGQAVINLGTVSNTFTIANTGSAALTLTGNPVISGTNAGDFSITANPTSPVTATTGTTTFVVKFAPTAAGVRVATITIPSDDPASPYVFSIRGVGSVAPLMVLQGNGTTIPSGESSPSTDTATDFGSVEQANGTSTQTFTIRNNGSAPLTLTGTSKVAISGANAADFTVVTQPDATVAAGGTKTFQIKFKAGAVGVRNALVTIASNDATTTPYTFAVTGTAVAQQVLSVLGNSKTLVNNQAAAPADGSDMGSSKIGTAVTKTFTIKNTGSAPLTVNGIDISGADAGDFKVTTQPTTGTPLAVGASTTFVVTFTAADVAVENAVLSIDSDDPNGAFSFSLKGTGLAL